MRLDRYLSNVTTLTRSQAQKAICGGRVSVDGEPQKQPSLNVMEAAAVSLDGGLVARHEPRYFMLHKPEGYVCSTEPELHPGVLDLLDEATAMGLHFVGRLDIDTTGLLLITDDGAWSHRILAPARKCSKRYLVTLAESLSERDAERLRQGILLCSEARPTKPVQLQLVSSNSCRLTITEDRYHQVKRMFAALGNRVVVLHRERIGALQLDPDLSPGNYRALTEDEISGIFAEP
ncbi:16S rRNA pseudouridine(516) synthase RsuA [Candidatus Endoriftia persephonae]|jgi:16S rRNA pseudouridine516 synthase|uniref:Pseudouridine synthase n=2 Tax=Gammaproteobacteria TaxID=1236 RepID=G2FH02_9GAMM|nr:16S rRNA pseudouridine(516) synthase RsuA [Candidatus Endoriftia persephone]EGW53971.1 ribosomal small subunit pseudouridine synthase A [endosymbiont of Tevnia jerichonana (vent Tica)]USF87393.1 16S rRNA pseudouridine(516) synthase RsuA [Candidatus Endoriftia persephone]